MRSSRLKWLRGMTARSNFENLQFLVLADSICFADEALGQFIDLLFGPTFIILADLLLVEQVFDAAHRITPDIPQRDLAFLDMTVN